MSFDGIFTKAITEELNEQLCGGKIAKIYQPYKYDLVFQIRSKGKKHQLFISANPSYARLHITNESYSNPTEPPMFCMLLRKHLEGSIIDDIEQKDLERIIIFHIRTRNEIGDFSTKKLIVEVMGRHSNIILIDEETGLIHDSIKHLSPAVNRHRTVMPGQPYIAPPEQHKANLLEAEADDILRKIDFNAGKIDKQIVDRFSGISPLLAKEIVYRSGLATRATLPNACLNVFNDIRNGAFKPQIIESNSKEFFYVLDLEHVEGNVKRFGTISEMLERFYYGKAERDRVKQQAHDLEKFIRNEINKDEKKIQKLNKSLLDAEKAEKYRLYGELLTANMYAVTKGESEVSVQNYYDEDGGSITIPLNRLKSPSENAQQFFQKYQKLKNSIEFVNEQIQKTKEEISYFQSLLQQVETASPKDIEEIREELAEEGYVKHKKKRQSHKKPKHPEVEKYASSDGTTILVGKNNKQNEYLTNKLARKDEIWLHTKDIPGSHVVIRDENPSQQTLIEAAGLAAYFSKSRNSSTVPVDYTKIRHVKKPSGAKPGYVIYDQQQTIFVTPDEENVIHLKNLEHRSQTK